MARQGPTRLQPRGVVVLAAVAAVVGRSLGLVFPVGADEAGFTLVARAWDPGPDSVYGPYWVDRSPPLIGLFRLADQLGGPLFIRVVGAAGCVLLVVAAAGAARALLRLVDIDGPDADRAAAWCAVLAAGLVSSGMLDAVGAKGELLGIPLVMTSCWLSLAALARPRPDRVALALAAGAGLAAVAAMGVKQNLVSGVVLGGAMAAGLVAERRTTVDHAARLSLAAGVGVAVPVLATVGWALATGVGLEPLWYASYGFRADAAAVIAAGSTEATRARALLLVGIAVVQGAALVLLLVACHARRAFGRSPTVAVAVGLVLLVDVSGLVLSGSFWRSYLFVLVPGLVLGAALLQALGGRPARGVRLAAVAAGASAVVSLAVAAVLIASGAVVPREARTSEAIADVSRAGDTLVVYGGRPSIVLTSGLPSPYPHLWSLPMRTLDPGLADLRALLAGPDAPTWVVVWVPLSAWDGTGEPLAPVLERRYGLHGRACGDRPVYLLAGERRPPLEPRCD